MGENTKSLSMAKTLTSCRIVAPGEPIHLHSPWLWYKNSLTSLGLKDRAGHCCSIIWAGLFTTIWGLPRYTVICPDTQMFLWRYLSSGSPTFPRSSGQLTSVSSSSGYGLPKFRNVGFEREVDRYRVEATYPHTVAFSPTCWPAWEAEIWWLFCPRVEPTVIKLMLRQRPNRSP